MSALLIGLCVDVRKEAEHFLTQCQRLERRLLAVNVDVSEPLSADVQTAISGGVSFALLDHQAALDTLKRRVAAQRLCPGAEDVYHTAEADENGGRQTSQKLFPYEGDVYEAADSGGDRANYARITSQRCSLDAEDVYVTEERTGRGYGATYSEVAPPLELMQSSSVEQPEDVVVQERRPPKRRTVPRFYQDEKYIPQSTAAAQLSPPVKTLNDEEDPHQSFEDPQLQFTESTINSALESAETDADELIDGNPVKHSISAALDFDHPANEMEPPTDDCQLRPKRKRRGVDFSKRMTLRPSVINALPAAISSRELHVVKLAEYDGVTPSQHGDAAVAMHTTTVVTGDRRADFYDRLMQCAVTETRRVDYTSGDSLTVRCFEGGGAQLFSDAEDIGDAAGGGDDGLLCPPLETLATAARQARAMLHDGEWQVNRRRDWQAWRRLASATHAYARTVLVYYERGLQRPVVYGTKIRPSNRGGTAAGCVLAQPSPVRDAFRLAVDHLRAEFAVYSDADRRKVLETALETLKKNLNKALSRHFQYTIRYQTAYETQHKPSII